MLTKEETKAFNSEFWGQFHKIMRGVKSSNGRSIGWLNYPTDVKHTFLRMVVDKNHAGLYLDFQFKDPEIRAIVWEQMHELKTIMEQTMQCRGDWHDEFIDSEGNVIARIGWELKGVNLYNSLDHPKIYEFLKDKLLGFDVFYQEFKEILIQLVR